MRRKIRPSRAWGLVPFAVILLLAFAAVPATAKGPLLTPLACPPHAAKAPPPQAIQARCAQAAAANGETDSSSAVGAIVAGSVVLVILIAAGGTLIARRAEVDEPTPAPLI